MSTTFPAEPSGRRQRLTAAEDYLEAILRLERTRGAARVGELAAALDVHKSTVTATLKALAGRGLVTQKPYAPARLTPAGRAVAARTTARHALIHDFLMRVLLLDDAAADTHACRMEHILDAAVCQRLEALDRFTSDQPRALARWTRALKGYLAEGAHAGSTARGGAHT